MREGIKMNKDILICLKEVLGKEKALDYIEVEEIKLKAIMKILNKTALKEILTKEELENLIYKLAFNSYGVAFAEALSQISELKDPEKNNSRYLTLINIYMFTGSDDFRIYQGLFRDLKEQTKYLKNKIDFRKINYIAKTEFEKEGLKQKKVKRLLKENITYDELLEILEYNGVSCFGMETELCCKECYKEYSDEKSKSISFKKLSSLMARLEIYTDMIEQGSNDISFEVLEELTKLYQVSFDKYVENNYHNFDVFVGEYPNLLNYLIRNGLVVDVNANFLTRVKRK